MLKHKNSCIKYKRAELEEYIRHPETCVKKIRTIESLRFTPNIIANFKESIMRILSKKIGKYDVKLNGVVLDFRKTQVLNTGSLVRNDSTSMLINVETDFYVFSPRRGAIVSGIVKHINRQSMEIVISVVIYRVFNVKVVFKGRNKFTEIHNDKEIKIRIKNYHFENVIPFIEGEMIETSNARKKIVYDDTIDSGISESSISHLASDIIIKQERMDIEYDEPINSFDSGNNSRKRKRQAESTETSQQLAKKIKHEVITEAVKIKQEIMSDSEHEKEIKNTPKVKDIDRVKNMELSTPENSQKKKKKKDKKNRSCVDDFESSLLMLFASPQVKQEKD